MLRGRQNPARVLLFTPGVKSHGENAMRTTVTHLMIPADVPPPYLIGGTGGSLVAVVLVVCALALIGFRIYKSKKK